MNLSRSGGLIAVPSAPVLTRLPEDEAHREAVEGCDFAITDSGFMVLLWRILRRDRLVRISGLRYLQALLELPEFRASGATFWVMPTPRDARENRHWLESQQMAIGDDHVYLAPMYPSQGKLQDEVLATCIERAQPRFVILCLGGGVQERLGYFLRQRLNYRPAIVCTGAAIAFLSGRQARIPKWVDRLYLGWLQRLLTSPAKFFPRYWHALRLVGLLVRCGEKSVGFRTTVRPET